MSETWALVPVKAFATAKSRLSGVLTQRQRRDVAEHMATDVLLAATRCARIDQVVVVGQGPEQVTLAQRFDCLYEPDAPGLDVSQNVTRVAGLLAGRGVATAIVIPTDLPALSGNDLDRILRGHRHGVSLYRARRDGGTNALIATPPDCVNFSFGAGSAQRHEAGARSRGHAVRILDDAAFQRDVDTPDDLRHFCASGATCATLDYLRRSGIAALMLDRVRLAATS